MPFEQTHQPAQASPTRTRQTSQFVRHCHRPGHREPAVSSATVPRRNSPDHSKPPPCRHRRHRSTRHPPRSRPASRSGWPGARRDQCFASFHPLASHHPQPVANKSVPAPTRIRSALSVALRHHHSDCSPIGECCRDRCDRQCIDQECLIHINRNPIHSIQGRVPKTAGKQTKSTRQWVAVECADAIGLCLEDIKQAAIETQLRRCAEGGLTIPCIAPRVSNSEAIAVATTFGAAINPAEALVAPPPAPLMSA